MVVWETLSSGIKRFRLGRENDAAAAAAAQLCVLFILDDEDEVVSDEERSCYNCRYRRWTIDSFDCMKS